jgi:hypothetical protein
VVASNVEGLPKQTRAKTCKITTLTSAGGGGEI